MENQLRMPSVFSSISLQINQANVTMQSTSTERGQVLAKKKSNLPEKIYTNNHVLKHAIQQNRFYVQSPSSATIQELNLDNSLPSIYLLHGMQHIEVEASKLNLIANSAPLFFFWPHSSLLMTMPRWRLMWLLGYTNSTRK